MVDLNKILKENWNKMQESPIGAFEPMDEPFDPENPKKKLKKFNSPGSFDKTDRAIITSPKAVEVIKKKFENTPFNFNFYFINSKTIKDNHSEEGIITDPNWFQTNNYGKNIKIDPNAITVIYLGNSGTQREMMTGWILAHRLGHTIAASQRRKKDETIMHAWREYMRTMGLLVGQMAECYFSSATIPPNYDNIIFNDYGNRRENFLYALFNTIGTMKSARDRKINRPYEFIYELLAQYLTTGDIKFNKLPYGIKWNRTTYAAGHQGDLAYYDGILRDIEESIKEDLDRLLTACVGKAFLM